MKFQDRNEAGQKLTAVLRRFQNKHTVVLVLPRGGAVLGAEVARELNAPFGLALVRKIGHPNYAEYAVGAVAEDGVAVYNPAERESLNEAWRREAERNARELLTYRRGVYFEEGYKPPKLKGNTVLIVDDGIATGLTMLAAVRWVRRARPRRIIVAAPVATPESVRLLEGEADEVIILDSPDNFQCAVGAHYHEFPPVDDEDVRTIVEEMSNGI